MRASINPGTAQEITWDVDEYITPELVDEIRKAGDEKGIDWSESPLFELMRIISHNQELHELRDRIYDEDPQIIELVVQELELLNPRVTVKLQNRYKLARLYLPILLVILDIL